ncbi:DDB1- and CUL4-associated factor 17 [Bagarius yarrelli]|uniref:DDB1-and CUL4-associated factor 17 n=1 Tax=Bagarius yarrelli TaxID=175774 RepID=A0A556U4R7_BAGYA|nr:DDB1- and CUL4-associated factor 17 [Bagarius yarrelli]
MCLEWCTYVRPLAGKARIKNVCVLLGFRAAGDTSRDFGTLLGGNLRMLKNIILQLLYELPKRSKAEKIEDSLLCQCPLVFGKSVVDVLLSQGVLAVSHSSKSVKLYSFEYIVKKAKNGVQNMKCNSLEEDWIFFHPDDSGRIIHAGPSTINVLKIKAEKEFSSAYEVVSDFSIVASRENSVASQVTVTSSGRTVKKRIQQLEDDPDQETFRMVKYEDELDLLAIVDVRNTEDEGQASVRLYHNQSGTLLKKIILQEPWDVTYSHEVYFDRDTIIHIEQERNNSYCCHVYKIKRRTN